MGTQATMFRSVKIAANFVCKLHDAVLVHKEVLDGKGRLHPMLDGLYITCESQHTLKEFLSNVFLVLAHTFISEMEPHHQFLVRGCIAYGPIYTGDDITENASKRLYKEESYRAGLLLGMPITQAYRGESHAPPFGLFIDESARAFAPPDEEPFPFIWWRWLPKHDETTLEPSMRGALLRYFRWQLAHSRMTGYEVDRIKEHCRLAKEYWS